MNPRYISEGSFVKLTDSIRNFPEMMDVRPIVVNQSGAVLGGNMRLRAAKTAGLTEVLVDVVDWTPAQEREFLIKDNRSFGQWDMDELANNFETEELLAWGFENYELGMTIREIPIDPEAESYYSTGDIAAPSTESFVKIELLVDAATRDKTMVYLNKLKVQRGLQSIGEAFTHHISTYVD